MENSWKVKYDSTFQSATTAAAGTSTASHGPCNQMEISSNSRFHPPFLQDLRSTVEGRIQNRFLPSKSTSCGSDYAEIGNSCPTLLSRPQSVLHSDFQEISNSKALSSCSRFSVDNTSVPVSDIVTGVPLMSSGMLSENSSCQNLRNRTNLGPVVSLGDSHIASHPVQHNGLQAANLNLQSSDQTKTFIRHIVPGNEKANDIPYQKKEELFRRSPVKSRKPDNTSTHISQKLSLEATSCGSDQSSFMSACPRVFCLETSGYLLLSNTGLLGIVCSCHLFHMSVSNFCVHSGYCGVNPGSAVRMDSGETVAEWRKLYFQQFGIRVLEDQSGWDWHEGLLATAGSVKCSTIISKRSSVSEFPNSVLSSRGLIRSVQPLDKVLSPVVPHKNQNSTSDALHERPQISRQDSSNLLHKGLIRNSRGNLLPVMDNQIKELPTFRCSAEPKFVGKRPDSRIQSVSNLNPTLKAGNSSDYHSSSQNVMTTGKSSDANRSQSLKEVVIIERDVASSNIELKLGQPYQQNRTPGNLPVSVSGPKLVDTLVHTPKTLHLEEMAHKAVISNGRELPRQQYHSEPGPSSSSNKEACQILGNLALQATNAVDASKFKLLEEDVTKRLMGPPVTYLIPSEGFTHPKATNKVEVCGHSVPKSVHFASHAGKSDPLDVTWNVRNGLETQLSVTDLEFTRLVEKGKGVKNLAEGSNTTTYSAFKIHNPMANQCCLPGVAGGSNSVSFSAVQDKGLYSCQSSSFLPDAFSARNINHYNNMPIIGSRGHNDHVSLRSDSCIGPVKVSLQTVSTGFLSATSTSIPSLTHSLPRQESIDVSTNLLDGDMKMLALRQMLEISKEKRSMSSLGMHGEPGKFSSYSGVTVQHLIDLSVAREHVADLTSKLGVSGCNVTSLPSGTASIGSNSGKLVLDKGFTNCFNFSSLTQGTPLCSMENCNPPQFPCNPYFNKEVPLRIPDKNVQSTCSCAQMNCSGRNFESRVTSSTDTCKHQLGNYNCSMSVVSGFEYNEIPQEEGSQSFDQRICNGRSAKPIIRHSFEWKDVPSKQKNACVVKSIDQSSDVFDRRGHGESQLSGTANKYINESLQIAGASGERETSNVSSESSAPAVTQASIEVNNMDSSTADAEHNGDVDDPVDEGSGIGKCWSSDESEKSAEFHGVSTNHGKEGSFPSISNKSSHNLLDELKLIDSLTWKKGHNTGFPAHEKTSQSKQMERHMKLHMKFAKRKKALKLKVLGQSPIPDLHGEYLKSSNSFELHSRSSKDKQILLSSSQGTYITGTHAIQPNLKHRTSSLPSKGISPKRSLNSVHDDSEGDQSESNSSDNYHSTLKVSGRKKLRTQVTDCFSKARVEEQTHVDTEKIKECWLVASAKQSSKQKVNAFYDIARPIVCGKYGEISLSNLAGDMLSSVKYGSLSNIMKTSRRCTQPKNRNLKLTSSRESKNRRITRSYSKFDEGSSLNVREQKRTSNTLSCREMNLDGSLEEIKDLKYKKEKCYAEGLPSFEKGKDERTKRSCSTMVDSNACTKLMPKYKKVRERSLYELAVQENCLSSEKAVLKKLSTGIRNVKVNLLENTDKSKDCVRSSFEINAERSIQPSRCASGVGSDALCCVCGCSNNDEINCLLDCSQCLIRVHQACYGVSRVPKGDWCCRPCRTNCKDTVCVLCGYGSGAQTQALQSRTVVKGLLKAWNFDTETTLKDYIYCDESLQDGAGMLHSSGTDSDSIRNLRHANTEISASALWTSGMQNQLDMVGTCLPSVSTLKVHNSITAGVLDSTVKQWVHMVCGLWTSGTRCPNVDTMSAFDVSAVTHPVPNVICSICNRPGGSCMRCRVLNCSIQFHPWCAHQKGLLQSEVEGVDNENVGFYGRCVLHATHSASESGVGLMETEGCCSREKELTCARTEGYKGRKRDGFWHNLSGQSTGKAGCSVSQDQLNAWIHINRQKSWTQGLPRHPASIESDFRKEYARYKQAKGWKYLVVYKSGIHALGLYTSRFIFRGEMVVEYIGEIVGLRVADKRENEYQSEKRLQYKSACYFFKINKEHIIDATCKGGIARFVNHSCLPNCVAKVISVRNEKKVVFFAERDIYPGEEITYDYHFNHEDEGKKIPCFCNAKNCRSYLN